MMPMFTEKMRLDTKTVAFCQDLIYDGAELKPLPQHSLSSVPYELATEPATLPEIEFGMQKVGTLSISDRFEVPARLAPGSDASGQSVSATHPSTEAETLDGLNAWRAIFAAYARAVAQQVEGKGLFCKPFFVRYAWRYADGNHSRPSVPALMLPAVLPPCLAVLGNEAVGDKRVISFSPSSCRYFSLRCRVSDAGTASGGIVALDFFISVPVSTHDTDASLPRGVMRWASASAYVGHWSESADDYADRTAEAVGLGNAKVWYFPPNPRLESELLQSVDFYRVASIPVQDVKAADGFFDVPVSVATDSASVRACERLVSGLSGLSPLECSLDAVPKSRLRAEGRLYAACSQMRLPAPSALAGAEVTVWAKRAGQIRRVVKASDSIRALSLADAFPRYIYYPCPGAFRMRIKQGARTWTLPLKPSADGLGAFWWGGLGSAPSAPSSTTMPTLPADNGTEGAFGVGCVVAVSAQGNEQVWQRLRQCGDAAPIGLASAPGRVIALTDNGVWQISSTAEPRLIAADRCLSGYEPCSMPDGLAYAAERGVVVLAGSSTHLLPPPADAPSLPGLEQLSPAPVPCLSDAENSVTHGNVRMLHCEGDLLYVRDAAGRMMAYSLASQAAGLPSASAFVVTRPFESTGKRLASVAVSGRFTASAVSIMLWGSHDGAAWTLVATSAASVMRPVCGTPYRWYAVAIASSSLPSALYALDLAWQ